MKTYTTNCYVSKAAKAVISPKKTLAAAACPPAIDPAKAGILDEFGELERWYREHKPKVDRRKTLAETIRGWYEKHPADQPIRAEGYHYYVDLSMCEEVSEVFDNQKAFDALVKHIGQSKVVAALRFTLKLIRAHLIDETEQAEFIRKARTGSRDISAVLKLKAA